MTWTDFPQVTKAGNHFVRLQSRAVNNRINTVHKTSETPIINSCFKFSENKRLSAST